MQVLGVHGFAFPLLLTSCHMGFSFVTLLPFMLREPFVGKHRATIAQQWKGLVAIGEPAQFVLADFFHMLHHPTPLPTLQDSSWPSTSRSITSVWFSSPSPSTKSSGEVVRQAMLPLQAQRQGCTLLNPR